MYLPTFLPNTQPPSFFPVFPPQDAAHCGGEMVFAAGADAECAGCQVEFPTVSAARWWGILTINDWLVVWTINFVIFDGIMVGDIMDNWLVVFGT